MTDADNFPFYQYARLVRQAHLEGASQETLRLLIEEATAQGAARALARCGLEDAGAGTDISELRELLEAWRDTKRTARRAAVRWLVRTLVAAIAFVVAVKLKLLAFGQSIGL